MSDPFRGTTSDNTDNVDKKPREQQGSEPPALTLGDSGSEKQLPGIKQASEKSVENTLGKLDISYGGANGTTQRMQKSEFTQTAIDKQIETYRPLIQNFLRTTDIGERITSHDYLKQISDTRESLSNATNAQDAVADALHLARLYQHIRYIEEAKQAIDLSLGIDPDHHQGNELFRELERMHPAELGAAPTIVEQPLSKSNLRKRILSMTGGKVIVVGDLLIDELLEGKPERISREAPVLILEHVDTELIPGGAANTANNIAALGGNCHAIGVCGNDDYANKMAQLFDQAGITHGLVKDPTRPTTVKTRILSKSHSFRQQLLRLDRISHQRVDKSIERQLLQNLEAVKADFQAIILSDYRAGVMTDDLIRGVRAVAAEQNLLLVVDAQDDFARFQNVTLMTPNQPDAEKVVGFEIKDKESLQRAGDALLLITGAAAMLVTRGGAGMVLFQPNQAMVELPAFNRSEVFDVSGAGDTVVAAMTLALVTGSSFLEAMALGNLAAGIVVKKPGTAITNQKEMLENLDMAKLQD